MAGIYDRFYGTSYPHQQRLLNEMIDRQAMSFYPPMSQGFVQEYYRCTPPYEPPHYCKAVPEHLVNYYQQLLNYYKQSGYKPKECERLCCSLNNLKIKY